MLPPRVLEYPNLLILVTSFATWVSSAAFFSVLIFRLFTSLAEWTESVAKDPGFLIAKYFFFSGSASQVSIDLSLEKYQELNAQ